MSAVAKPTSAAHDVQKQIDSVQEELHGALHAIMTDVNAKKSQHYAKRHSVIAKGMQDGQLPATFWADALIAALAASEATKSADGDGGLLGPYDARLLRDYLLDINVHYTERSVKVVLCFKENPFFEESELWAESVRDPGQRKGSAGDEEEEEEEEDECRFSGITWKPGHGVRDDEDDDEDEDGKKGDKKGAEASHDATRGWSFLEAFSAMPPHPEEDSELGELDDDDLAEAAEQWEDELDDRRDLLQLLLDNAWEAPLSASRPAKRPAAEADGPPKQRVRTE